MNRMTLSWEEVNAIKALLKRLADQYDSVEDEEFLNAAQIYAHELPTRVRTILNNFRLLGHQTGLCLISGFPIDDSKIRDTPTHWQSVNDHSRTLEEEILLVLLGALLGDAIGWSTQQNGHIIHEVMPVKEHEQDQLGIGSEQPLTLHVEDAFHPYRGDYIGLMCLRNVDRVATICSCIDMIRLDKEAVKILFQPRFTIRPDESHLEKNGPTNVPAPNDSGGLLESAYQRIQKMSAEPEKIAVLFGDPTSPYIRIDPYFMNPLNDDPEAEVVLNVLIGALDSGLCRVVLESGDILFIDNYKTAHGRDPFKARYDGNDRWLKRINITRDLRKSRCARMSAASRVIY
jgi:Fe(II)/alpha-ketoglutarate-dependent arginine beta-hydroxylase